MRHVLLRIGLLVMAALVVSVGVAAANGTRLSAKSKVNKGDVRLCLNYKTGHVRAPKANRCNKNERFVTVRKATGGKTGAGLGGPQGPAGPQGATGAQGATWRTGAPGAEGKSRRRWRHERRADLLERREHPVCLRRLEARDVGRRGRHLQRPGQQRRRGRDGRARPRRPAG